MALSWVTQDVKITTDGSFESKLKQLYQQDIDNRKEVLETLHKVLHLIEAHLDQGKDPPVELYDLATTLEQSATAADKVWFNQLAILYETKLGQEIVKINANNK